MAYLVTMDRRGTVQRWTAMAILAGIAATASAQPQRRSPAVQGSGALSESSTDASAVKSDVPESASGGGANADFDSLIDLIISTVAVETWAENGGGEADIRPFAGGGIFVDAKGTLRRVSFDAADEPTLKLLHRSPPTAKAQQGSPRRRARIRYVSLPRLEREITRRQAAGRPLDEAMLTLAGLRRAHYVFIYPDSGDLVLAGPADDWYTAASGTILSVADNQPVVRLDDLIVLLRREFASPGSHFGCSITPRQDALARTQAFLRRSSTNPLRPGQRDRWLSQLRDSLGRQDIQVFGVDPASRVARILVEADYHMKLVGMGLADSVAGVESYLDSVRLGPHQESLPLAVLRWWFAMGYRGIRTTADADAFEFGGRGVQVLSENELLTEQGKRIHTGRADPLTIKFAHDFTTNFARLCQKYPLYTELRNIFDLALAAALIRAEELPNRVGWNPDRLLDAGRLRLPQSTVPRQVDTVLNHRLVDRRHIVVGVSGGVLVAPEDMLERPREVEDYGTLTDGRRTAPHDLTDSTWWWDFEDEFARR